MWKKAGIVLNVILITLATTKVLFVQFSPMDTPLRKGMTPEEVSAVLGVPSPGLNAFGGRRVSVYTDNWDLVGYGQGISVTYDLNDHVEDWVVMPPTFVRPRWLDWPLKALGL